MPLVQHVDGQEIAECARHVELHVVATRQRRAWQRHVFPVRLVGRSASGGESLLAIRVFGDQACVIVIDFVIVVSDEPRAVGVRCAQDWIAAIPRVTDPIIIERLAFAGVVSAYGRASIALVNIIAYVNDEIGAALHHVGVSVEIALLVVLAARYGDLQRRLSFSER